MLKYWFQCWNFLTINIWYFRKVYVIYVYILILFIPFHCMRGWVNGGWELNNIFYLCSVYPDILLTILQFLRPWYNSIPTFLKQQIWKIRLTFYKWAELWWKKYWKSKFLCRTVILVEEQLGMSVYESSFLHLRFLCHIHLKPPW